MYLKQRAKSENAIDKDDISARCTRQETQKQTEGIVRATIMFYIVGWYQQLFTLFDRFLQSTASGFNSDDLFFSFSSVLTFICGESFCQVLSI